jgi:hypothetical protein
MEIISGRYVYCIIPVELFVQQDLNWAELNDLSYREGIPSNCLLTYVGARGGGDNRDRERE